jgi:plastocyanin domain-containing protein
MNIKAIGLTLTLGAVSAIGLFGCKTSAATPVESSNSSNAAAAESGNGSNASMKKVNVIVNGEGFVPSSITAKKGEHLMLEFTRVTDQTCAKKVVFPELGLSKDLPLNTAVTVHVPTDGPRTLNFQCGMGMLKGSVVIM